ncbi:MAG: hypothetical protein JWN70_2455 [Planctomycetaceae bacterium]|nr:hypothetical protein [Planctomycetaceae bacterium]
MAAFHGAKTSMAPLNTEIQVTFIDDATGESIGATRIPPSDLPETFELDTTLHLGDVDWTVIAAIPLTRAEYSQSQKLTLRLRRVEYVDPHDILFSLPTICDAIPGTGADPVTGNEFELAEDDWRQFEFVSHELAEEVDAEIAQIRLIHENYSAEVGWSKIHVRRQPEPPILSNIPLLAIGATFGGSLESASITYCGADTRILDGYSFTTPDGLIIYGVAPGNRAQVIAIGQTGPDGLSTETVECLRSLARAWQLDLVNWGRCARAAPDDPLFEQLLTG